MSVFDWKDKPSLFSKERVKKTKPVPWVKSLSNLSTSVDQFDMEGRPIKRFPSMTSAARCLDISRNGIANCVNGKLESYKGFKFKMVKYDKEND